jgi:hypothetical protein
MEGAKLFILTENQEKADAILRGAAEDLVFTETHSSSDGINALANIGTGPSTISSRSQYGGVGVGENESEFSTAQPPEALAAVRLVSKEEEVIWSTTQESLGARFRGASCRRGGQNYHPLKEDSERARKLM